MSMRNYLREEDYNEPSNQELGIEPIWTLTGLLVAVCMAGATGVIGFFLGRYFL